MAKDHLFLPSVTDADDGHMHALMESLAGSMDEFLTSAFDNRPGFLVMLFDFKRTDALGRYVTNMQRDDLPDRLRRLADAIESGEA